MEIYLIIRQIGDLKDVQSPAYSSSKTAHKKATEIQKAKHAQGYDFRYYVQAVPLFEEPKWDPNHTF